jgi:phosphoglycerol transferase MdoB-like AlkP superfamily enzyme
MDDPHRLAPETLMPQILKDLGRRLRPAGWLAAVCLVLGLLLRLALWMGYGRTLDIGVTMVPQLVIKGLLNDLPVALACSLPLAMALLLGRGGTPGRMPRLRAFFIGLQLAVFVYLAFTEYYFFDEFNARLNIVAFDYLMYPTEVAGDLWAEYPVLRVLAICIVAATAVIWLLRTRLLATGFARVLLRWRLLAAAMVIALVCLYLQLWRTDLLSHSSNRVANEIAQNGYSSFFRAALTNEIEYDKYYATGDATRNLALLRAQFGSGGTHFIADGESLLREFPARADGLGKLNVVLVSSESFGAEFSKLHGSSQDLTPEFDHYAQQSLWFRNTYASGTRTVRGLEAMTASFPPIPTVSILRRPGNEGVATWGAVMRELGYHTSFLYGGYGYFDNMNYFYEHNGFEVLDRRSISKVRFENIWGVSDEDLFDRALEHFDDVAARKQPFFSIIMTTSNHKPFTFRPGLEAMGIPAKGGGRKAGVKYADYAMGQFFRAAEKHAWFRDTVFIVIADHGARVYGKAEIPLKTYEIPLLVYSPAHIPPRRVDRMMTQVDLAPTVLGLLGLGYRAPFFGQDALAPDAGQPIALFNHNHDIAILKGDHIVVFGLNHSVATYRYDREHNSYEKLPVDVALRDLGVAYFQTASSMFREGHYRPAPAP